MLTYSSEHHRFEDGEGHFFVPFPFLDMDHSGQLMVLNQEHFHVDVFYKKGIPENDIRQVRLNGERIGWIFPVACLVSKEHSFADNSHFSYYAFHAYEWLLSNTTICERLSKGETLSSILLGSDHYDSAVLLMFPTGKFKTPITPELMWPSLVKYGYFKSLWGKGHFLPVGETSIHLELSSEDDPYIHELLTQYLFCNEPALRFFRLYQVIELLIERDLVNYLSVLVEKGKKGELSTRSLDSFIRDNSELKRIRNVFDQESIDVSDYDELNRLCREYLKSKDIEDKEELSTNLYHVRNLIVHRLRKTHSDMVDIDAINDECQLLVMDLIIRSKASTH